MNTQIAYKSGFKYIIDEDLVVQLEEDKLLGEHVETKWIILDSMGLLLIRAGFACDGPSGLTIDTKNFMRGSFVHDALYWLIRNDLLDASCREAADRELRRIIRLDGMNRFRAWYVYRAVRLGGGFAVCPAASRKIHRAPKLNSAQKCRWLRLSIKDT